MNASFNNSSDPDSEYVAGYFVLPIFMFAIGVVGNIIAIAVLSRSKKERRESAFYTLVCGLAVTDLLGTCLASPLTIFTYMNGTSLEDQALCEFDSFLLLFFGVTGLSIICAMSGERYLAISRPYLYQRKVSTTGARRLLCAIYAINALFCALPALGMGKSVLQESETWCFIDWRSSEPLQVSYSFLYAGTSTLLIAATLAFNVAVCGTLLAMQKGARCRRGQMNGPGTSEVEVQMMVLLVMTSVVVLLCSTPLVVRVFVNQIMQPMPVKDISDSADLIAIRMASVNPILDPWIYILLRRSVFRCVLGLAKGAFRHRRNSLALGHGHPLAYLNAKSHVPVLLRLESFNREELNTREHPEAETCGSADTSTTFVGDDGGEEQPLPTAAEPAAELHRTVKCPGEGASLSRSSLLCLATT
ncbi:prostaglandin E2 receptor EP4 subtype-like [Erpetoichthys calabaricus]|uniref:prostaglandin E2 receptor EP4 subtype-like n=1 Tax=Erpetoichthys calabaricus TaxID=27687 RepID=UPI0010A08C7C|nr:prostaglandin E2 receptor EP4 subtype-like [Erpetoichthys calabaricus]